MRLNVTHNKTNHIFCVLSVAMENCVENHGRRQKKNWCLKTAWMYCYRLSNYKTDEQIEFFDIFLAFHFDYRFFEIAGKCEADFTYSLSLSTLFHQNWRSIVILVWLLKYLFDKLNHYTNLNFYLSHLSDLILMK